MIGVAFNRVKELIQWLMDSGKQALDNRDDMSPGAHRMRHFIAHTDLPCAAPAHVHSVAAVLWQSYELPVSYDLRSFITKEFFT